MRHLVTAAILCVGLLLQEGRAARTALDDYVAASDPAYGYSLVNTISGPGYKAHVLNMTSQSWRSPQEVNRTVWRHWLTILVPDGVSSSRALLWINGGNNTDTAPTRLDSTLLSMAAGARTVVADLRMVPNQLLVFPGDGRQRYEDAIIAYTFDRYMATGDPNWPVLLPMVKSAVRAMDTVQAYLRTGLRSPIEITEFVVSGGSKRGWTTWLCAAVDPRVIAISPLVIDVLNMGPQMRHHFSAYGFYSKAIQDYVDLQVFERLDTPEGRALQALVDPYAYRDRYTLPKLLIHSTGDQFFLPDSAQFYVHDLPGPTYLRYCPNTDHRLMGLDAPQALLTFYQSVLTGLPRPEFSWTVDANDQIVIRTVTRPQRVRLWQAGNPDARDFRLETLGGVWTCSDLGAMESNLYVARVPTPAMGWTAFFAELTFDSGPALPATYTTEIHVVPRCLPYAYKLGLDGDWDVDMADVAVLASHWLTEGPSGDIAPLCGDGWVDFQDFAQLASERTD
ncbi:MAG: PhoPQ-activated pathogenicity-related family protein [Phycisphaerae bacterium]|nr:PhoPQ-activated pathogenicity-related family protein [Phycisphaerae bacterium]